MKPFASLFCLAGAVFVFQSLRAVRRGFVEVGDDRHAIVVGRTEQPFRFRVAVLILVFAALAMFAFGANVVLQLPAGTPSS